MFYSWLSPNVQNSTCHRMDDTWTFVDWFVVPYGFTWVTWHLDCMGGSPGTQGMGWQVHLCQYPLWASQCWAHLETFAVPLTSQDPQSLPWVLKQDELTDACWTNEIQIIQAKKETELNKILWYHRCGSKDSFSCAAHPLMSNHITCVWQYFTLGTVSWTPEFTWGLGSLWVASHIHTCSRHCPHRNLLHSEWRGHRIDHHKPWVLDFPPHLPALCMTLTPVNLCFIWG